LSFETSGHLYARECCAHVRYAIGAIAWRNGDMQQALNLFAEALNRVPGQPPSLAAIAALTTAAPAHSQFEERVTTLRAAGAHVDAAHAEAIHASLIRNHAAPPSAMLRAFEDAPASAAGWTLPLDPILRLDARDGAWKPVLAALRQRAA
jgi:hypothetical protein